MLKNDSGSSKFLPVDCQSQSIPICCAALGYTCALLYYAASSARQASIQLEYGAIERKKEEAFLLAFEQVIAFAGISTGENAIDICWVRTHCFPPASNPRKLLACPCPLAFENIADNI